jgi:hypothetical protein
MPFAPPPCIDYFTKQLDAYGALDAAGHARDRSSQRRGALPRFA